MICRSMSTDAHMASSQHTSRDTTRLTEDVIGVRNELVDFIVHRAFYPMLMADRAGPDKAMVEHVQKATRAEVDRFRSYDSAEDVIYGFERDVRSRPAQTIHSELKLLHLPVIDDLRDEFERKARELGFEPDTLLTSLCSSSDKEI